MHQRLVGLDSSFPYLLPEGKLAITGRGVKNYCNFRII